AAIRAATTALTPTDATAFHLTNNRAASITAAFVAAARNAERARIRQNRGGAPARQCARADQRTNVRPPENLMTAISISVIAFTGLLVSLGCWCGWQMLRQNGRMLLRLDELEKRLDELEFGEPDDEPRSNRGDETRYWKSDFRNPKSEMDQSLVTSA